MDTPITQTPTPEPATADGPNCAVANGSLPMYALECGNLIRAAKLLEDEAVTWSDGWAFREKDGSLRWDKDGERAQIRWMKLRTAAENLRRMAARFAKKANKAVNPTCAE